MSKSKILFTFLTLCYQLQSQAIATSFDRDFIEGLAKRSVEDSFTDVSNRKVSVTAAKLDPRIVIKPCDQNLQANIPDIHNSRNVNVKITCEGSSPWNLYVPVKVTIDAPVVVAKYAIDRGSMLTPDNIQIAYVDEKRLRGEAIGDVNTLYGAKAKRNIVKGKAISPNHVCSVCKGDNVTLIALSSTFSIKTSGTSVSNGHVGDKVRVKNNRSGKLVTGRVSGVNKVTINL
ncbi:flagellar basal body P-ring formation chaperone FlgA [Thalassotalea euphylliae]|uniref:Flagella basal body P-ring formation protein FlgA n=1 Tax=Thalassotalea euphylliae TaxID=1655234 RepID=A0A3E0U063_9GAMM|nr:flagellar basal body P-ring formation chaperone FlgA [Thalassotalea euphylliae]REL30306.1 flagella basal body P-ring formation protein FlgA [Thalassotalea euphylliae]